MLFIQSWWNSDGTSTRRSFLLLLSSILKPTLYRCLNPQKMMGLNVENVAQRKSSMLQKCDYYQFKFLVIVPTICGANFMTLSVNSLDFWSKYDSNMDDSSVHKNQPLWEYMQPRNAENKVKTTTWKLPHNLKTSQNFQLLSEYTFQQAEWLQGFFIETLQGWVVLGSRWSFSKSCNCIA